MQTKRLYLRELTSADAQFAYDLNSDPEVIRYTGDGPFESVEAARIFLENYASYTKYGFGRWGVVRKSDGELLGWCGLKYTEDIAEFDIGFRFFKKYWNQGYATEAALLCLKIGFHRFDLPEIVGRAMVKNTGSVRVLEKIGLRFSHDFDFDGEMGVVYVGRVEMG